jgi:hypothetical protein
MYHLIEEMALQEVEVQLEILQMAQLQRGHLLEQEYLIILTHLQIEDLVLYLNHRLDLLDLRTVSDHL